MHLDKANPKGTYVYCVVAASQRPPLARVPRGLPGMGPVRLLDAEKGLFAAVADAPLDRYGEAALRRGLADLDWLSRAAVAHEAVVEAFTAQTAVLPMKLFTLFTSDDRAVEHVRAQRRRIAAVVKRVANHQEWGVRVVLERERPVAAAPQAKPPAAGRTGAAYLTRKKAQREALAQRLTDAQEAARALFDRLAGRSRLAKRRLPGELPAADGRLLLDAAFLVPRARTASFRALVSRESRALARRGCALTCTGPWPPYSFVQD